MYNPKLRYNLVREREGGRFFYVDGTKHVVGRTKKYKGKWELWKYLGDGVKTGDRWAGNYNLVQEFDRLKPALVALKLLVATNE
jgi:hypothetical protein